MSGLLPVVLIAVLVVCVVYFAAMGLLQHRRAVSLARRASDMQMRFAAEDPFDAPRRYGHFAALGSGHSPQACNVAFGRLHGWAVRAFDFRCEAGHGPRRLVRHLAVTVLQTDLRLPEVLLWREDDPAGMPGSVGPANASHNGWACVGDVQSGERLAEIAPDEAVAIEIDGASVLVALPVRHRSGGYLPLLAWAETLAGTLRRRGTLAGGSTLADTART